MKKPLDHLITCLLLLLLIFTGCDKEQESECVSQPDIDAVGVSLEILELQDEIVNISTREEMIRFLNDNPVIAEIFLKRSEFPNDSIMIDVMLERFTNPYIDTLAMEVDRVFGDLTDLKTQLNDAYGHVKYYYPDFELPVIKTTISGIEYDLFMSDSLVVIGLDYFLGEGARFRPIGMFQYMLARYTPEKITPSLMLLYGISPRWNKTDLDNKTMLADMITYGKAYYFAKHMMPCTPDSVIISYSAENMTGVRQNAGTIWAHFLENELLFETSHMVKKKYLDERPNTYEIGDKAPGRIATWVGWEIVKAYMKENPGVSLQEMMAESNAQKILDGSHYSPSNQ